MRLQGLLGIRPSRWWAALLGMTVAGLGALMVVAVTANATRAANTATMSVSPASQVVHLDGGNFQVAITIDNAANLAAFEFRLTYDPDVVALVELKESSFLESTGRQMQCPAPVREEDNILFGCGTIGETPPGPSGFGLLATATFRPVATGVSPLVLSGAQVSNPLVTGDSPVSSQDGIVQVLAPGEPTPASLPDTPTPHPTSTPWPTPTVAPGQPTPPPPLLVLPTTPAGETSPSAGLVRDLPSLLRLLTSGADTAPAGSSPDSPEGDDFPAAGSGPQQGEAADGLLTAAALASAGTLALAGGLILRLRVTRERRHGK